MTHFRTPALDPQSDIFDANGDIFLNISSAALGCHRLLRVSSEVLCRVSPVFAAMLGPSSPFAEAAALRLNGSAVVSLPDDDADAVAIVMTAAHGQQHLLPTKISVDILYAVAVLCDKYDMTHLMPPWPLNWANRLTPFPRRYGYSSVLAIAWLFGLNRIFTSVTREFIHIWKPEERGDQHLTSDIHIVPDAVVGGY